MENKNYIVINGKKAELTEEQLKQLGIEVEKPNPYERAKKNEEYYYSDTKTGLIKTNENEALSIYDKQQYESGNYCANEEMARQDMLHDLLNRKLRQFSNLNGGIELNSDINKSVWENSLIEKYYIYYNYYNYSDCELEISNNSLCKISNIVYFKSEDIAERAIKEIVKPFMEEHKEFIW